MSFPIAMIPFYTRPTSFTRQYTTADGSRVDLTIHTADKEIARRRFSQIAAASSMKPVDRGSLRRLSFVEICLGSLAVSGLLCALFYAVGFMVHRILFDGADAGNDLGPILAYTFPVLWILFTSIFFVAERTEQKQVGIWTE